MASLEILRTKVSRINHENKIRKSTAYNLAPKPKEEKIHAVTGKSGNKKKECDKKKFRLRYPDSVFRIKIPGVDTSRNKNIQIVVSKGGHIQKDSFIIPQETSLK